MHRDDHPRDELYQDLRQSLNSLTPLQRQTVELYFFEGLSQGDIARKLGVSQQVIHKRLYGTRRRGALIGGAIARLRHTLQALGYFPEHS